MCSHALLYCSCTLSGNQWPTWVLVNYRCGKIGLITSCCLTEYTLCDRRQIMSRSKVITIEYLVVNLRNLVWTDVVTTNGLTADITLTTFNIYDSVA